MIDLNELTEQEKISFAISIQVFPSKIVSCVLSRELQMRLYALEFVKEHLENESVEDDIDQHSERVLLARAVLQVISVALTDTREKVVTLALALLDQVVKFCLQNEIPSSVTYRSLEPIFSLMLVKASDFNNRVAQGTIDRIVMLCNCFRVTPYAILPLVFKPARSTVLYRQSQSRIDIVARLVDEFGVFNRAEGKGTPGGLEFENITEFAIPYLSHTNGEVRITARKLIIDVCKFLNKTRVGQFLSGVKPLIVESIQKELEPKKPKTLPRSSPTPSRPVTNTPKKPGQSTQQPLDDSTAGSNSGKRKQVPTSPGVNLHMDSLKSLLVEPEPSGVSKSMVKNQNALSPDEDNDSTASEENRPSVVSRTTTRPSQRRARSNSSRVINKSQQQESGHLSGSDSQNDPRSAKDRFCVFCDERSSAFTDEGLVVHYWNDCAMLANCPYCKIIIEVPTLVDHTLKDCPKRKFVKQCENCRVIMASDTFLTHMAAGCTVVPKEAVRCPLCTDILPSNDEADWKLHLLNGPGCPMNKKSHTKSQKPRPPAQASPSNLLPQVNTSQKHSSKAPISTPTSPQSSSSSSSVRTEPSIRHRGATFSSTGSTVSCTMAYMVDKNGIRQSSSTLTLPFLGPALEPSHLSQRPQYSIDNDDQHQFGSQRLAHHSPQSDFIHPLDPSPALSLRPTRPSSPWTSNPATHQAGSGSRIPKLGMSRSASSNSG
ncbi:hypothetical protein BGZ65_005397 [Modicella reniformis]|uniref:TOG domain-containing protein n=1 Tax=Modicella reniformis TaxID=1440133 RepID=A0A9P6MGD7_9FUNG|nr:hypothetical protein BGZ65_005397 [Modicella reniformis]